ncbi:GNAT family N-acetyltransferase [Kitasatospora sp. NBC_00240]|uniref:GNAT family N-acetyltransferase n=1 Tax=Kitasatospora sp. NBC_00240 TaxID=2903567 RepID=UPI00225AA2D3|nr:GNAT family N-acetyltransferase [Kitasatospora sp. NBC_00240]MCX5212901.1 GNAT family N-acetyltransferase [Kitasatospora sp. NBC_00240]
MTSQNPEQQQLDPHRRHQQALLAELDEFYDAVPRKGARAEDFGPLTLFVREGEGWPFYARPTLGWTGAPATADDVRRVLARQRELGLPESFEWVAEHTPGLRTAIEQAGLAVHEHPLLVLPEEQGDGPAADRLPDGVRARVLDADDPALASAVAAPNLAFAEPGTALGTAGPAELAAAVLQAVADGAVERTAARIGAGVAAVAAVVEDGSALCSGQYQRVGPVCEIVGVGTLPSARRRGLGLAVTSALVADARARGVRTVFLSAADEDVARIYRRAGFRNTATALIAEPKA